MFVVSHVSLLHYLCLNLMRFILLKVFVLEEYSNYLPHNKLLAVKHVSIVFG